MPSSSLLQESLLSQALEKRVDTSGFAGLAALGGGGGGGGNLDHNDSASDTASDRPESLGKTPQLYVRRGFHHS